MKTIVFISGQAVDVKSQWLALLNEQLANETILLPEQISDSQVNNVDIAVVANPDPKELAKFPNLVWVQSLWAGVDKLIGGTIKESVKLVKLADPHLAKTMAESVLAWTLYLQRNMPDYAQQQLNKQWHQLPCIASRELRVSVLGAGMLGVAALNALRKLDYKISCWSREPKQLNGIDHYTGIRGLQTMLNNTDILINLLPLTQHTYHLLDENLLKELPKGAKLMNFSRGAVIDTKALLKLLDSKHLSHAVLDVFEHEPLTSSNKLWDTPNITVLPHISAPTNMYSASKIVVENIKAYRDKNVIPNSVDVMAGY